MKISLTYKNLCVTCAHGHYKKRKETKKSVINQLLRREWVKNENKFNRKSLIYKDFLNSLKIIENSLFIFGIKKPYKSMTQHQVSRKKPYKSMTYKVVAINIRLFTMGTS